jgi:hypothetical protein
MDKEFITYEQALALKELGFNEPCFGYYDEGGNLYTEMVEVLKAPLYQQAFRWFRDKHKLDGQVTSWTKGGEYEYYYSAEPLGKPSIYRCDKYTGKSYEEAELECLKQLIKICQK